MYLAFSINNACYTFGKSLENELDKIDAGKGKPEGKKRKKERTLAKWLELPQKYRKPGVVGSRGKQGDEES